MKIFLHCLVVDLLTAYAKNEYLPSESLEWFKWYGWSKNYHL